MIPLWDQTGVPIHFHSSTTSGSASVISRRVLSRVAPRQSPSSAILCEIRSEADGPAASDFFIVESLQLTGPGSWAATPKSALFHASSPRCTLGLAGLG